MDGTQYKSGLASLFSAVARVERRYVYHMDIAHDRWNVFEVVNGQENYLCNYVLLADAQDFCRINNWQEINQDQGE
jgi:hypothetical protein